MDLKGGGGKLKIEAAESEISILMTLCCRKLSGYIAHIAA